MRKMLSALVVIVSLIVAVPASAQVAAVVNPQSVTFTPSPDHDAVLDGVPVVTRYDLSIYIEAGMIVVGAPVNLGKPTPVAGLISVTNPVWFAALTPRTRYVARVTAVGPTGTGVSDVSNPFLNSGPPAKPGAPIIKGVPLPTGVAVIWPGKDDVPVLRSVGICKLVQFQDPTMLDRKYTVRLKDGGVFVDIQTPEGVVVAATGTFRPVHIEGK